MDTFTLELELPEAVHDLGYDDEEICREVPVLLVLKRFREGAISTGKAARILGISRRAFLDRLAVEGISLYDPVEEEFAAEVKTIQNLQQTAP